jgi:hypothetical protein
MSDPKITVFVSSTLNGARTHEPAAMTWGRLKEKLRAHHVPGWCDESPDRVARSESAIQLARWESEGGSRAASTSQRTS